MLEIMPKFEWRPVLNEDGSCYRYAGKPPGLKKEPAIYRWVLTDASGNRRFYVGETGNFKERIGSYLASTERRHRRFRRIFEETCNLGGKVELNVLQFAPGLFDQTVRRALECLCCAQLAMQGEQLLNPGWEKLRKMLEEMRTKDTQKLTRMPADLSALRQGTASAVAPSQPRRGDRF